MPAQGLGRCDDDVQAVGLTIRPIAMPAQGLGRCDPWAFTLATQSYPDRNARAGAWTRDTERAKAPGMVGGIT